MILTEDVAIADVDAVADEPVCKKARKNVPQKAIEEEHQSADEEESHILELSSGCKAAFDVIKLFFKKNLHQREPHHGWEHAVRVLVWSQRIAAQKFTKEILMLALLHDVCDHKFKDWDENKFSTLLDELMDSEDEAVRTTKKASFLKFIDAISFSKEKKNGMRWYETALGHDAALIEMRNIVSDADKLEALGKVGAARCYATGVMFAERDGTSTDVGTMFARVVEHCHEKLFLLGPQYMRTQKGLKYSEEETETLKRVCIEHGVKPSDLENTN